MTVWTLCGKLSICRSLCFFFFIFRKKQKSRSPRPMRPCEEEDKFLLSGLLAIKKRKILCFKACEIREHSVLSFKSKEFDYFFNDGLFGLCAAVGFFVGLYFLNNNFSISNLNFLDTVDYKIKICKKYFFLLFMKIIPTHAINRKHDERLQREALDKNQIFLENA